MKNVVILATGGTIAGAGEPGKNIGYKSGVISAETLLASVPGLRDVANVRVEQFCNINSDDVTSELWIQLAVRIKKLAADPQVDGVVVTHGTDTMEETAFFLSLTLNVAKPVVLTGSMRPSTAAEPDGPANLLLAVKTAVSKTTALNVGGCDTSESCTTPAVYVAFANKVMNAAKIQKVHANDLDAFAEVDDCCVAPKFDVRSLGILPKVSVLYFNAEADETQIEFAAKISEGVVIAGAGAGEFSKSWIQKIESATSLNVVISTRINRGKVVPGQLLVPGTIAAYGLPPAKAAVLLRLALTQTKDSAEIQKIFEDVAN